MQQFIFGNWYSLEVSTETFYRLKYEKYDVRVNEKKDFEYFYEYFASNF